MADDQNNQEEHRNNLRRHTFPVIGYMTGNPPTLRLEPYVFDEQEAERILIRRLQNAPLGIAIRRILARVALYYIFKQDETTQILISLVLIPSSIYMYRTEAAEILRRWAARWRSRGRQGVAAPPQPPSPASVADDVPAVARKEN